MAIMITRGWAIGAFVFEIVLLVLFYNYCQVGQVFFLKETSTSENFDLLKQREFLGDWDAVDTGRKPKGDIDWTKIPRKPAPKAEDMHDKWIVVTTISSPTEDVKKLAAMDGWKVVVVGDTKTPADWSHPNCVFLSVEKQRKLGYRIHDLLPYKIYGRKNMGYLYAIQHGAKIIYETDDDNSPTSGEITFHQKEKGDFYVYKTDSVVVNPYEHFGQSTIWPRGYPLDYIADPPLHKFVKCTDVEAAVQQGTVNGDPDVDAIYRLTRKDKDVDLKVEFDAKAPAVVLPRNTLVPYNAQNTLHLHKAMWGLLLPVTVTFRVTDIWRGYWAQRLMWDLGLQMSYFPPNAIQFRNAHNYLSDFMEEHELYHDATRLVKFLVEWKPKKDDFLSRALELSVEMAQQGFYGMHDATLTQAWLEDLVSIGYEIPSINPFPNPCRKVAGEVTELHPREYPSSYLRAGKKLKNLNN
ncbi:probable glycosyltransferase STELLO1 [Acropora millepora]|uniref:probable glycosyltransferase STELLO1 n=1 Tax=Acropora millepora TaxID=45264 RepID=UPI001CF52FB3|nr:probable glycosyltransferase STELLO1 [Acropora millepora]XP_044178097.1 probable glycosyltransferase STELLO1 [Acropora millepora]